MKQIYWIDDNVQQMLYIVQGAIAKLWKIEEDGTEGIASKLIIFGNACEEADTDDIFSQKDEKDAKNKLSDMLRRLCSKEDGPNQERTVYNTNKELIRDKVKFLYKKENADDASKYRELKRAWNAENLEIRESDEYKKASNEADKLIQSMEIEPGIVVGIDIALLFGDLEKLRDEKRILSMELCYKLSTQQLKCFMYSSDADDKELMENWRKAYERFYGKANVKIYQRSAFMQKREENIISEIEDMFD